MGTVTASDGFEEAGEGGSTTPNNEKVRQFYNAVLPLKPHVPGPHW